MVALAVTPVTALASATPATAALPSKPTLKLERIVRTSPFAGSSTSVFDVEGLAYVARDNSVWLADDDGDAIHEVNASTGALKRTVGASLFDDVRRLGGTERATAARFGDVESLAYDTVSDSLYIFSGSCCTVAALPTAFRMTRSGSSLRLESWQPLVLTRYWPRATLADAGASAADAAGTADSSAVATAAPAATVQNERTDAGFALMAWTPRGVIVDRSTAARGPVPRRRRCG